MGEVFEAPRLMIGGGLRFVRWVVTNAMYYPVYGRTFVELDVLTTQEVSV
jgi:hypothetical protein